MSLRFVCKTRHAFTLIELLVSFAVMTLILGLLFLIVNQSYGIISATYKTMDSDADVRQAASRIQQDFERAITNKNLGSQFLNREGNDTFTLFSQVRGYEGSRNISKLTYRIDPSLNLKGLLRGNAGASWDGVDNAQLTFAPTSLDPVAEEIHYDEVGEGIFRMELSYLLANGTLVGDFGSTGREDVFATQGVALEERVKAIIITLAAVSPQVLRMSEVTHAELATLLPDAKDGEDTLSLWQQELDNPSFYHSAEGIPATVRKNIRIYQIVIPIDS